MTELLDRAIAKVRTLPLRAQDDLASMLLAYAEENDATPVQLTTAEAAEIAEAEVEAQRGDFASVADMQALWAKYGG
ncbi:hypothetical protein P7D22_17780 [Lichenihabitans sp. Uapishka_5]|uniref:hypothetical protein n=1 Tax=Lichenihabitans sp. Uapishka_5 TaxID=3037302 RepID=UPI0029E7D26B|nr:hypothetical protein [Lichenihabitans sp. Uapishka_5]MDX7953014.1 hypothetical protein [Lichenihabitans sp. Uapishka_5]